MGFEINHQVFNPVVSMYVVTFAGVVFCSWGCTPIKSCAVIYTDLVTAKIAKEKQQLRKVDKIIRQVE